MANSLADEFCTPPEIEETAFDKKAFSEMTTSEIAFENQTLSLFTSGEGPVVLLTHGFGSRASHLALIARYIVNNGFKAVLFDAPAHGKSKKVNQKNMLNMHEYGRAIFCVAKSIGPIYAIVGHSLGAFTSVFNVSGTGQLATYKFSVEKLILISSPISVERILENYAIQRNELHLLPQLTTDMENDYNFKVSTYNLLDAIQHLNSKVMFIHDEDDAVIPSSDVLQLRNKYKNIVYIQTKGYGHEKILLNRKMLYAIKEFL